MPWWPPERSRRRRPANLRRCLFAICASRASICRRRQNIHGAQRLQMNRETPERKMTNSSTRDQQLKKLQSFGKLLAEIHERALSVLQSDLATKNSALVH